MKLKKIVVCLLAFCVLCGLTGCAAQNGGEEASPPPEILTDMEIPENRLVQLTIPAPSLENNLVGEAAEQGICVYLPPDYETADKEYPVLYFLPGYSDNYLSFGSAISKAMQALRDEGTNYEMIIVTVNSLNKLKGCFFFNSPVTGNWEDFVTQDVVGYVDSHFRTINDPAHRGLAGFSMGGTGAIHIAMHTTDLFGSVYALNPELFNEEGLEESRKIRYQLVAQLQEQYAGMTPEEAAEAYAAYMDEASYTQAFTFAYGSAFAPDPSAKAPYVKIPATDENGAFTEDEVMGLYRGGYGDIPEKLELYKDNLSSLACFQVEYSLSENFHWMSDGCLYFIDQMQQRGIPFTFTSADRAHELNQRTYQENLFPYFAKAFGLE